VCVCQSGRQTVFYPRGDRSVKIAVPLFPSGRKQIMAYETVATIVIGCLFSLVVIGFVCMYTP